MIKYVIVEWFNDKNREKELKMFGRHEAQFSIEVQQIAVQAVVVAIVEQAERAFIVCGGSET